MIKNPKDKRTTLPLSELVEDMDLYPRHAVDTSHVSQLVQALHSGAQLPPIIADADSKRIIDGFHRSRAYRRVLGAAGVVDVVLRKYESQAEMVYDAAALNATHGRRLDAIDRTRCVIMLRAAGFNDEQVGTCLRVPAEKVEKLAIKVATAAATSDQIVPGTNAISLKRSVRHLAGSQLTPPQVKAHATLPGTSFLLIARQLCAGLQNDMVNLEDEKLVEQLKVLRVLIDESLKTVEAEA